MDYEKKYKDALRAVKKLQETNPSDEGVQNWINDNFPELKESEDEKIRKGILELVRQSSEILDKQNQNNMIAWLEKQGEQKPKWTKEDKTIIEDSIGYFQSERDLTTDDEYIMDLDKYCRLLQRIKKAMEE